MSENAGKVLVCYASGTGCTKGVAERIGETLARGGAHVDVAPVESHPNPADYDAVVAGSGIRAGSWIPAAKKWLTRNASTLNERPIALFSVGIALAHGPEKADETRGCTSRLLGKTGLEPIDIGAFAGWFHPEKFNAIERKVMRVAKAPEGDFRDWTAIEDWATHVGSKLGAVREPALV